jgi:uncharacterized protein YjbI with pentapeptide repeats
MANKEHLARLALFSATLRNPDLAVRTVRDWNEWRQREPSIVPDLEGAEFKGSQLAGLKEIPRGNEPLGINLAGARLANSDFSPFMGMGPLRSDLRAAILHRADLTKANLSWADLTGADLSEACLMGANLLGTKLRGADLRGANLVGANLCEPTHSPSVGYDGKMYLAEAMLIGADLSETTLAERDFSSVQLSRVGLRGTDLTGVNFHGAHLDRADLRGARLTRANLTNANLTDADLRGADLRHTLLIETDFTNSHIDGCQIYGASVWEAKLNGATQSNLIITDENQAEITVDNIEVAQFIYLLINNEKIRRVIDTITSKVILILGRFTPERKAVLDALREALRTRDRLPIVFDFTGPGSQTTDETISTLAHMARFVIADLTDAKSILQELRAIVPNSPSVLVQPLLLASQEEPGMFDFFRRFPWVLEPYRYHSQKELLAAIDAKIITPVEARYGG